MSPHDRRLLTVRGLRVVAPIGAALVQGTSLDVAAGECVGIVGESGSGKSLTLRAVMGIVPSTLRTSGTIERGVTASGEARLAMIFQEPATALNPTMRVGDLVASTWRLHHPGTSRDEARAKAVELFESVGITEAVQRVRAWPHELSGGMRQRVMIAAALAVEPDLLLCDEPTTALDVRVQSQILDLLRSLVSARHLALLFVSHDLAVVSSLCERIVVMRDGLVVEEGATRDVVRAPRHPYSQELLAANLARRAHVTGGAA